MKGPIFFFFFLKGSTLMKITNFLSLTYTSHEHHMNIFLYILTMFTMSRKDLKHVNQPSLAVLTLPVLKCVVC